MPDSGLVILPDVLFHSFRTTTPLTSIQIYQPVYDLHGKEKDFEDSTKEWLPMPSEFYLELVLHLLSMRIAAGHCEV